ncbi:rhodanese-like domain-containing protein [Entomospira nematocerorum]|uniref:Rhodanese domain-containing protein n=1 Tax=Entomospira nematocerorum TaxID=2719987 RepID=A0A968GGS2_9SPIO|nr:rhodanese-like domain-containing protein [Entomospira nematocera]NIZ47546.1 hypothetical protein [Entomospira nematocera]WDI33914.1 rhodanese-like domain-containing protein [Entomospira nematocera]
MDIWKPEDAVSLQSAGAFIVDVREPEERMGGRAIENTMNIPLGELPSRLSELPPKDQMIYVYCESGMRSQNAALFLESKGYKASNLVGGYRGYHAYKASH